MRPPRARKENFVDAEDHLGGGGVEAIADEHGDGE